VATSEQRAADLNSQVQRQLSILSQETLRKEKLALALVDQEVQKTRADTEKIVQTVSAEANRTAQQIGADAERIQVQIAAEAEAQRIRTIASADAEKMVVIANSTLEQEQKRSQGDLAVATAKAEGIHRLLEAYGGRPQDLILGEFFKSGILTELSQAHASALQGLQPKISVWNTGADADVGKTIRNVAQSVVPVLDSLQHQTGIDFAAILKEKLSSFSTSDREKL